MVVLFRRTPGRGSAQRLVEAGLLDAVDEDQPTIGEVVHNRLVSAHFQPIVHLKSREVVGYEAFARGPEGTIWEKPALMFAAAKEAGLENELDLVAHAAAFKAAIDARLDPSMSLFINAVPTGVGQQVPADLAATFAVGLSRLRVFVEMSEKALDVDPRATLAGIDRARAAGWGVSLDNVGLTASSLALLPFAHPDLIKIDVSIVDEEYTHPHAPRVMNAVSSYAERTRSVVMATGIETEPQTRIGRGLGATFGQGYLFGKPVPLAPQPRHTPENTIPLIEPLPKIDPAETPYHLAVTHGPALPVGEGVLATLAGHLEQRAALDQDPPVVLACLPQNRMVSGAPLGFLQLLARSASYIAALVGEVPMPAVPDVPLIPLSASDPLRKEGCIILIGPHYSVMLVARLLRGSRTEYAYRLVHDRVIVVQAARILLNRVTRSAHP